MGGGGKGGGKGKGRGGKGGRGKGGKDRRDKKDGKGGGRRDGNGGGGRGSHGNGKKVKNSNPQFFNQNAQDAAVSPASDQSMFSCMLCANDEPFAGMGVSCGHSVCYKCAMRMRYLMDDKQCPICKKENEEILFTARPDHFAPPDELSPREAGGGGKAYLKDKFKITFDDWGHGYDKEGKKMMSGLVEELFEYKCHICDSESFRTIFDLKKHVEKEHSQFFCDTCLDHREVFLSEQMVYNSREELAYHKAHGDCGEVPMRPHRSCEFCRKEFPTHDALLDHMRQDHVHCFICLPKHKKNEYFKDYISLYMHHATNHFVCYHEACVRDGILGFQVFDNELLLKKHRELAHGIVRPITHKEERDHRVDNLDIRMGCIECDKKPQDPTNLAQSEKPVEFVHMKGNAPADMRALCDIPVNSKPKKKDRYPALSYGLKWQNYKPKSGAGPKASPKSSDGDDGDWNDGDWGDGGWGDGDWKEDNKKSGGSKDSGNKRQNQQNTRAVMMDYEKEQMENIMGEIPQTLIDLPAAARTDDSENTHMDLRKPSFLVAINAVFEVLVGGLMSCKSSLVDATLAPGYDGKIHMGRMKEQIESLSPLQLDSLSMMRTHLLEMQDSSFATDQLVGLRPLFFRTLRTEDHAGTANAWLIWKHQAFLSLQQLTKDNEKELVRIYIGLCVERNVTSYAGVDRAKEYPSLEVAAAHKEDTPYTFNPEERIVDSNVGAGSWAARGGRFSAGDMDEAFPSLGGPATPRGERSRPQMTMAQTIALQQQQRKDSAKRKKTEKKKGVNTGTMDFPSLGPAASPTGLQPVAKPRSVKPKTQAADLLARRRNQSPRESPRADTPPASGRGAAGTKKSGKMISKASGGVMKKATYVEPKKADIWADDKSFGGAATASSASAFKTGGGDGWGDMGTTSTTKTSAASGAKQQGKKKKQALPLWDDDDDMPALGNPSPGLGPSQWGGAKKEPPPLAVAPAASGSKKKPVEEFPSLGGGSSAASKAAGWSASAKAENAKPKLTQEERDLQMAMELQQKENQGPGGKKKKGRQKQTLVQWG